MSKKMTLLEKAKELRVPIEHCDFGDWVHDCPFTLGIGNTKPGNGCADFMSCVECYAQEYDPDWNKNETEASVPLTIDGEVIGEEESTKATTRRDILEAAMKCVCGDREQDYGSPENNFQTIAAFWSNYLGHFVSSVDVAAMLALLKIARIASGNAKQDNWVDLAGYAACGGEIEAQKEGVTSERNGSGA